MSETQKIAFFINIYNALVIHGHVEKGVPTSTYTRYKKNFPVIKLLLNISGHLISTFSLQNI